MLPSWEPFGAGAEVGVNDWWAVLQQPLTCCRTHCSLRPTEDVRAGQKCQGVDGKQ
jgi:hypothetical protein